MLFFTRLRLFIEVNEWHVYRLMSIFVRQQNIYCQETSCPRNLTKLLKFSLKWDMSPRPAYSKSQRNLFTWAWGDFVDHSANQILGLNFTPRHCVYKCSELHLWWGLDSSVSRTAKPGGDTQIGKIENTFGEKKFSCGKYCQVKIKVAEKYHFLKLLFLDYWK